MNLNTTKVCDLPRYPGIGSYGPMVLTYIKDQQLLAACGTWNHSCYQLSLDQPSGWQPLPAGNLSNSFCSLPSTTRSHLLQEIGWLIIGQQDGRCGISGAAISTELLTPQLEWTQPPISSPYGSGGYPYKTCSVTINPISVIVTGGVNGNGRLSSAWMLDLTDYTWTRLQDMPGPKSDHGCTVTATGELMVVGGSPNDRSVYSYNLINNTWSQVGDLPNGINTYYPVMFLWNKHPIILESGSFNIWILDRTNWKKMEATSGGSYDGETAITVPSGIFKC